MEALKRTLILNAGSSSLKWALLNADETTVASGDEPWASASSAERAEQLQVVLRPLPAFAAVGHRVVHGGLKLRKATRIDAQVRATLETLVALDPLHMQPALAGIDAITADFPDLPQVAAFDTAFHATISEAAAGYGLPFEWTERWGLRRFGFHGLSVAYSVRRSGEILGQLPPRLIVCHLGSGCSVTAVAGGHSVDTTMGFTPLEGLLMATRAGSVDAGLLLHLQLQCGVSATELGEALTSRSGWLGVSGVSADLRKVMAAADNGAPRATLAYEQFILSIRRALGAMTGVLGGVDAVVFTGGVGEHSARVRRDAAAALDFAGMQLDAAENESVRSDADISTKDAAVRTLVIAAREDLVVHREVLAVLAGGAESS